jgi:hypothetical protein
MGILGRSSAISLLIVVASTATCCAEAALATGRNQSGRHWFGVGSNHRTLQEARDAAMRQCLARGPNCSVVLTYRRKCFAIVFGRLPDRRSGYEWVTRDTLADAQSSVMSNCSARGGACELKYSSCDNIDEAMIEAQRREAARQEAERRDAEIREIQRQQRERQEAQRREAERQEADRKEQERRLADQMEWNKRESERRDWERREAERREAERRAADEKDQQKREAQRREWDNQESDRRVAEQREKTRQAEIQRKQVPDNASKNQEKKSNDAGQEQRINYLTVGAGAVVIGLLVGAGLTARRSLPRRTAIAVAIIAPLLSGLIYFALGLKPYLTLAELPIVLLPYGGGLFLAAIFKWHE